ncbi:MAG: helix-turn-helix domain-containing protein [Candidatus Saccharimonadales bacterium]
MTMQKPKLAYPIEEAFDLIGVSRTRGYQLINSGKLKTFKDGKRRLATHRALEECVTAMERDSIGKAA